LIEIEVLFKIDSPLTRLLCFSGELS